MFPNELRVSSFPDWFPHYACTAAKSAHTDFVGSSVSACSGVTRHLHFCLNDRGLLRAIAVTRGMERTPNKSQHTKLNLEKKILPPLLPGFEVATFRSRVRRSTNKLSRLSGSPIFGWLRLFTNIWLATSVYQYLAGCQFDATGYQFLW